MLVVKMKQLLVAALFRFFGLFPIQNKKIVVNMNDGKGFGENGRYIVEELLKRRTDLDIVWLANNMNEKYPKGVRAVKYFSLKAIYDQATARIWIGNKRKPGYVRKRPSQYYIMTWHAGISLKRVEKEAENALSKVYVDAAKADSKMINVFLSSSKWETDLYRRAFWYDGEILECGYPRQDSLFTSTEKDVQRIRKKLKLEDGVKMFLYAPSFRKEMIGKSESEIDFSVYKLEWEKVLAALQERFGGKWCGAIRLHPNVAKLSHLLSLPENIVDVSKYPDMQELLICTDCLLTDYSSSVFDLAIMKKPGFMYVPDFELYQQDRGLYFTLEELPFAVARDQDKLCENILAYDDDEYQKTLHEFMIERCGLCPGGQASKKVADRIEAVIKKANRKKNGAV